MTCFASSRPVRRRGAATGLADALAEQDLTESFQLMPLLPFQPRLLRAFACWERHWEQAARGLVRRYLPRSLPPDQHL